LRVFGQKPASFSASEELSERTLDLLDRVDATLGEYGFKERLDPLAVDFLLVEFVEEAEGR